MCGFEFQLYHPTVTTFCNFAKSEFSYLWNGESSGTFWDDFTQELSGAVFPVFPATFLLHWGAHLRPWGEGRETSCRVELP